MITAIVVAAGNSERFGKADKLFLDIGAITVIERSIIPFVNCEDVEDVIVVVNNSNIEKANIIIEKYLTVKPIKVIVGGNTRIQSVKKALEETDNTYVVIHDGARPNLKAGLLNRVIEKTKMSGACVPVVPLKDSIRNEDGALMREWFSLVQTPQGFETSKLKIAYQMIFGEEFSDDAAVYESVFGIASTVEGDPENIKITYPADYYGLQGKELIVGVGYDAHCLVKERKLILGGIEIPFEKGLMSHSDGDALTHAIMDAILTALNEGDIGKHFPDTDEKYKDISSIILLEKVSELAINRGYLINNIAAVIMAEAPKLSDYIPSMAATIAKSLKADSASIGIAATTTEGLGIIGEQKGIAAYAIVSLKKKN